MSTRSEGTIMNNDLTNGHARGFVQQMALVAMVMIGAFLVVLPLATNLPAKSSATGDRNAACAGGAAAHDSRAADRIHGRQ
jgi:hypothetical protein